MRTFLCPDPAVVQEEAALAADLEEAAEIAVAVSEAALSDTVPVDTDHHLITIIIDHFLDFIDRSLVFTDRITDMEADYLAEYSVCLSPPLSLF